MTRTEADPFDSSDSEGWVIMTTLTCTCPPTAVLFSTGNGGSLPPTRRGLGTLGVVTVSSMMRYSSGRGRASFVMSLPYSPLV